MSSDSQTQMPRSIAIVISYVLPMLTIVVPVLYFVGRVHQEAYWGEMKVPYGVMAYSFEDYVYVGYSTVVLALIQSFSKLPFGPLGIWLALLVGLALVAAIAEALKRWPGQWLRGKLVEHRRRSRLRGPSRYRRRAKVEAALGPVQWINSVFLGVLMCLVIALGLVLFAHQAGQARATSDLAAVASPEPQSRAKFRMQIYMKNSSDRPRGIAIGCAASWCVLWGPRGVSAVPTSEIERFEARTPAAKAGRQVPVRRVARVSSPSE